MYKMLIGFREMYNELFGEVTINFPKSTEFLLVTPSLLWLFLFILFSLIICLKDLKFQSKRLNGYLLLCLFVYVIIFTIIIFYPLTKMPIGLSSG